MRTLSSEFMLVFVAAFGWMCGLQGCSSELSSLTARVCQRNADCPSSRCVDGFCSLSAQEDASSVADVSPDASSDTSNATDADIGDSTDNPDTTADTDVSGDLCLLDRDCSRGERCAVSMGVCVDIAASDGQLVNSEQGLGFAQSEDVALGDIDGDGDLDAVVANDFRPGMVYLNEEGALFADSGQLLGDNETRGHGVALGDLDGDGDLDAFIAGLQQPNRVYLNERGLLVTTGQALGEANSREVALGDLDGDGDLDAVVANFDEPSAVWLNNGDGEYAASEQSLGTFFSQDIALGDLDGDGDLDVVLCNDLGQSNRVILNDGEGVFTDTGRGVGAEECGSIELGDVDGDGDLDVFIGTIDFSPEGEPDLIFLNDGEGAFTSSGQSLGRPNAFTQDAVLADLDGDGDLDVFVADEGGPNRVFTNNGRGVFTDSGQMLLDGGDNATNGAAAGDLDNDGDLDIFTANIDDPNRIWFNE